MMKAKGRFYFNSIVGKIARGYFIVTFKLNQSLISKTKMPSEMPVSEYPPMTSFGPPTILVPMSTTAGEPYTGLGRGWRLIHSSLAISNISADLDTSLG